MIDTIKKAEAIARDIGVPPQPEIAIKVLEEMNCDCPDLTRISELVKRDVSLSARVLKVANSPFFSRGGGGVGLSCGPTLGGQELLQYRLTL